LNRIIPDFLSEIKKENEIILTMHRKEGKCKRLSGNDAADKAKGKVESLTRNRQPPSSN
jgi:hypothetical protein